MTGVEQVGEVGRFRQRFLIAFVFSSALVVIGTVGFARFPGWSAADAFYMTVITLSMVGYAEVHPLTGGGRAFATFLIIGGITLLGVWFALITATLVKMDLAHAFRRRRTMKAIEKLKNHVIVCGGGRMGRQVLKELRKSRTPYVLIEIDPKAVAEAYQLEPDGLIIEGDATHDDVLVEARIGHARGLVCTLSADTDNLFVCLTGRDLQPNLTIVSRAYDEDAVSKLRRAGADQVISPNVTGGIRIASVLLRPGVVEEIRVPKGSPLAGHSLAEAKIPRKTGLIVLAIRHGEGRAHPFLYNPGPAEEIKSGDRPIVLGRPDQMDSLRATLQ